MERLGEPEALQYDRLRLPELQSLPRAKTLFFITVSPIEVHGPHLPTGTDVIIGEALQRRYMKAIATRYPALTMVELPSLYTGADALPIPGSLSVPAPILERLLVAYGKGLAKQGFHYLLVADNHGGPRHQMAMEAAARRLWRRHRFCLIDPFNLDFRQMVQHDPDFLARTRLQPGTCGDDPDSHAGTNETSLMLAVDSSKVDQSYREVAEATLPPTTGGVALVAGVGRLLGRLGASRLQKDLAHLANTLAWVNDPHKTPYMGAPARATQQAGEAMLQARVENAVALFEKAFASGGKEPVHIPPMLWWLRLLRFLPE